MVGLIKSTTYTVDFGCIYIYIRCIPFPVTVVDDDGSAVGRHPTNSNHLALPTGALSGDLFT